MSIVPVQGEHPPRFGCGHPRSPDNLRKIGGGRVACRECRRQIDARHQGRDPLNIREYAPRATNAGGGL